MESQSYSPDTDESRDKMLEYSSWTLVPSQKCNHHKSNSPKNIHGGIILYPEGIEEKEEVENEKSEENKCHYFEDEVANLMSSVTIVLSILPESSFIEGSEKSISSHLLRIFSDLATSDLFKSSK